MPTDWQIEEETPVSSDPSEIKQMVSAAAKKYGVPENLAMGVAAHESAFNPFATHHNDNGTKDWGVMQLNDTTVKDMGVEKPLDAKSNIDAGVKLLSQHLARYGGDQKKALWAYADGSGSVDAGVMHPHVNDFVNYVTGYGQPKSAEDWNVESEVPLSENRAAHAAPVPAELPAPGMHQPQLPAGLSGPDTSFAEGVKSILKYPAGAAEIVRAGAKQPLIPVSKIPPEELAAAASGPFGPIVREAVKASPVAQGAVTGVAKVAEQLTSPENIALIAGSEGLGLMPVVGSMLPRAVSGYFSYKMLKDVYDKYPEVKALADKGDAKGAAEKITELGAEGALGALGVSQGVFDVTGRIGRATEAHNVEAAKLVERERNRPSYNPEPAEFTLGSKTIPVKVGGADLEIRPAGMGPNRRPFYDVVDPASGEVKFGGYGAAVQDWLRGNKATPNAPTPPAGPAPIVEKAPAASQAQGEISKGGTFETPTGKFTVQKVANGFVSFEKETPGGQVIPGTMRLGVFQKMVQRGTSATVAATPTVEQAAPAQAAEPPATTTAGEWKVSEEQPIKPEEIPATVANQPQVASQVAAEEKPAADEGKGVQPATEEPSTSVQPEAKPEASKPEETKPVAPLTQAESLKPEVAKTLQEGAERILNDGTKQVLKRVPISEIQPEPGHPEPREKDVQEYQKGYSLQPVLRENPEGGYTVYDGHHRITADDRNGATDVLAWVPAKEGGAAPVTLFRGLREGGEDNTVGGARFYSGERRIAEEYAGAGGTVQEHQVAFKNLLEARDWMAAKEKLGLPRSATMPELIDAAKKAGHDGITFKSSTNGQEYIHIPPEAAAEPERKFSSTQVELPKEFGKAFTDATEGIKESDLTEDGRETEPHITLKYGIHDNEPAAVKQVLKSEGPITATIGKVSIFKGEKYDVVKLDVQSPDLHRVNAKIAAATPVTDTHPTYQPHITLAYVKPGEGEKYVGHSVPGLTGKEITFNNVTFSGQDKTHTTIPLESESKSEAKPASGFKVEMQVYESGADKWYPNGVTFPTEQEAKDYGHDKMMSWMMAKDYRVVPSDEFPNYNYADGQLKAIQPSPEPKQPGERTGAAGMADAVYEKLRAGLSLGNVTELNKLAEQYFGAGRTSGVWTPKDAFDAMEAGINKYLLILGKDVMEMPADQALAGLRNLMERITSQGVRTEEQDKFQQFSTPPTESYLVSKLANIKPEDVMLEPSAGNGGLAVWSQAIGAKVYVNEISDRRRQMLEVAGFPAATAHDGEIINALLDPGVKPTVIVMNPPFSAGGAKTGVARNNNQYGFNHVDSALQRLAPGGRLVVILGGGRADDANGGATLMGGPSGAWFTELAKRYNVRANIRISGKEYQKYGTAFATRIIVIDKDGPTPSRMAATPSWDSVMRGNFETLEEAYNALREVAESRPEISAFNAGDRNAAQNEPRTPKAKPGTQPSASGGGVQPGGGGTGQAGGLGGESQQPGGSAGTSPEQRPGETGERNVPGESPNGPLPAPQSAPAGAPEGGAPNAPQQRPLTREEILAEARRKFAESRKPQAAPPQQPPAQRPPAGPPQYRPPSAPRPPQQPQQPQLSDTQKAAEEAKARMRARMAQRNSGDEPIRQSLDENNQKQDLDPETLIDLATMGAAHMVDGKILTFPEWSTAMMGDVGDMVEFAAENAGMAPDDVLREVYDMAGAISSDYGVSAEPAPPPVVPPGPPLSGDETNLTPLSLDRNLVPESDIEDSVAYVEYRPSIKGAEHPGSIVESKVMSTVPLPPITYRPTLPETVLKDGSISAVQMEAIALAGQQNNEILPSGERGMMLVGDGTGVGKGRIAAGILWDNYRQGRKRLIWLSQSWDLMQDAIRDLNGVGAKELTRGNMRNARGQYLTSNDSGVRPLNNKFAYGTKIKHDGLLFTTYGTARAVNRAGARKIDQIAEYLRGDDDGDGAVLIIDEAHNLKNAVGGAGNVGSLQGRVIREMLGNIPKLRVTAFSATAATELNNMGWMDRLGIWGPGTAFPTGFSEFASNISNGRLAAMELIATELKAQGKYVARTLSYKGVVFEEKQHELTDDQKAMYRTASQAWKIVFNAANNTIRNTTNGGNVQASRFSQAAGGAMQRFFSVLITALKTPTAIELANEALANNKAVVITMVNTNEAAQKREKNRVAAEDLDEDDVPEYDFGPTKMLTDLVEQNYPVQQFRDDVDDNGNPIKVPVTRIDEHGNEVAVNNPQAEAERDELIAQIKRDLHLPENPLDILINSLGGPAKVAEVTGRAERFDASKGEFVKRGDPNLARKDWNINEIRQFQDGKKLVAVLTGAANAGISAHSSLEAINQRQRLHITLQMGWKADSAMQMLGRTHRTNQAHPPHYIMLYSDLAGEKRFIATIARRLGSLGALSKGQKNAIGGTDLMDKVNFETAEGEAATASFYAQMLRNVEVPGAGVTGMTILADMRILRPDGTIAGADRSNVKKLLNRLMALDPDVQNAVYNYFYDIFQSTVQTAIDRGTLDTGVKTLPGDSFKILDLQRAVARDPKTGAETYYYPVEAQLRTHRVSPDELQKRIRDHSTENPRVLRNDKGKVVLTIDATPIVHASGSVEPASYFSRPDRGKWTKIANRSLRATEINEWATDELQEAQSKFDSAERELKSAQRTYDDEVDYQRQRVPPADQANFKPPTTGWYFNNLEDAKKGLDSARTELDSAKDIAVDPMKWAKDQWGKEYEDTPTHTAVEHHLVGRAVMRYWNALSDASGFTNIYTTTDSKTGQRVVGVDIPPDAIARLIARIEGGHSMVNARQLMLDVLRNNTRYTLEGGIQVQRARIAREQVIQMIAPNRDVAQNLQSMGLMYERGVVPIYYVPNRDDGPREQQTFKIVERVLAQYPVQPEQPILQSRETPGFYSAMERVAEAKLPNRSLPDHILGVLKNPQSGVKADELKWSGIETWLADKKGPVSKQEVLDFIRENNVTLQETQHGRPGGSFEEAFAPREVTDSESGKGVYQLWVSRDDPNYMVERKRNGYFAVGYYGASSGPFASAEKAADSLPLQGEGNPKYGNYTVPGGKNYRELIMTLPPRENKALEGLRKQINDIQNRIAELHHKLGPDGVLDSSEYGDLSSQHDRLLDNYNRLKSGGGINYLSSHWDELKNPITHIRFDDRTGPNGEKIMHIAEVQDDWAQAGRKKGYRPEKEPEAPQAELLEIGDGSWELGNDLTRNGTNTKANVFDWKHSGWAESNRDFPGGGRGFRAVFQNSSANFKTFEEAVDWARTMQKPTLQALAYQKGLSGVQRRPFAKDWHELGFKRALRYAVENGYDQLTWDTGETQAKRYDLSKQVSKVAYNTTSGKLEAYDLKNNLVINRAGIKPEQLEDYVGKEVAQRLIDAETTLFDKEGDWHELSGIDLKVGGEGMKGFYDKILPEFAKKYVKKWGATVEDGTIARREQTSMKYEGPTRTIEDVQKAYDVAGGTRDVYESPITGQRLHFPMTRVAVRTSLADVLKSMEYGHKTFGQAMKRAAELGDNVADIFGGKMNPVFKTTKTPVHSVTITPAMREGVMQGQPMFAKGQLPASGASYATYRNGILWVGSESMKAIAEAVGVSPSVGLYIPITQAYRLRGVVKNGVQDAVQDALANNRSIVVVKHNPGDKIEGTIATARHELFHATEDWSKNGARATALLDDPLAQKAALGLGRAGYRKSDSPRIYSEIGAHLAAGPVGWKTMGLNRDEAKQLFARYLRQLDDQDISRLRRIAPQLNEELHAERSIRATEADIQSGGGGPDRYAQESAASRKPGEGVRQSLPARGERERGAAPILTDLAQAVIDRFGDDGPKANYSGLGSHQTRFIRNLSQTEKASAAIHTAAIRAASSRGQAATILRAAVPVIQKELKDSDHSWEELRLAMIESRLRGLRERWQDFANQSTEADDEELEKGFSEQFAGLLEAIQGKKDIPQDTAQTAAALHEAQDWDTLRDFLAQTFNDAADSVATVMEPEWFDDVTSDQHVQRALAVYKRLVEQPMAQNHAINEGVFSDALGPLDTYYPLISTERQQVFGPGRRLPYRAPRNQANMMATGLSEDYDASMAAFRDRLAGAVRANDKAALIKTIQEEGWLNPVGRGHTQMNDSFIGPDGQEYASEKVETSPARTIIQQGKIVHVPAGMSSMPQWLARELRPILERQVPLAPTLVDKIVKAMNTMALTGPTDAVFHSANLLGTLVANTPFLADSPGWKVASLPILKKFTAMVKIATTDPSNAEAAKDLIEMAKVGLIPDRFGSVEYSRKAAEEMGAEVSRFSMAPLLFGRKGLDIRARLIMYRVAKQVNPDATPQELFNFVNQLGVYVPALQGEVERALKRSGLSPFYTAGSTMLRNGVNAITGAGPMPKRGMSLRLWQQFTGGAIVLVALWMMTYKALNGKYPQDDKRAKFLDLPVPASFRHSTLGNALWGRGSSTGYLNFGFFDPLVGRGARLMGIPGAFEAHQLGGNKGQMTEAAQRDFLNAITQPGMGPVPRALFVGISGQEPYLTGFRDRAGRMGLQFFPAIPPKTKAPAIKERAAAAAGEVNAFYKKVGVATGMLPEGREDKANQWVRMVTDLAAPGLVGAPSNPTNKAEYLRGQRAGTR